MLDDLIIEGAFGPKRDCTKRIRAFEAAWARLQSEVPGWPPDPVDNQFHTALLRWLKFHQAILIGELVPEALKFLRHNPASEVLRAFDHVIVDEYQDLNKAEQELIDLVASHGATAIVGDMDQSIYRFRHANPEGIDQFDRTHAHTHDENLAECRRCPRRVVAIADHLIRRNHIGSLDPRLRPKADNPEGEVHIVQWPTLEAEIEGLANYVEWLIVDRHFDPGDILVLTPRRLIGYGIRDRLVDAKIEVHSFYHEEALESDKAQEAFVLLCLLANREDRVALRWVLGHGSQSGRREAYRRLRRHCEATGLSPWAALTELKSETLRILNTKQLVARFVEIRQLLDRLQALGLNEIIEELLPAIDECKALREAALLALPRSQNIGQLFGFLRTAVTQPETPEEGHFVRVMSLHKSKGLTARVTVVAGCIEGLIPYRDVDATPEEQQAILEEQRRLFYVAISRCTEVLVLSSSLAVDRDLAWKIGAWTRRGRGGLAATVGSQFLQELGPSAPAARNGADWSQAQYQ